MLHGTYSVKKRALLVHVHAKRLQFFLIFLVPEDTRCRGLRHATIADLYPFKYTSHFPSI
jgi:hypothetical protein